MVPPSASSTDHFTEVLAVPVTWAAKRTESPGWMSVSVGAVTTTMVWPAGGDAPGWAPVWGSTEDPPQAVVRTAATTATRACRVMPCHRCSGRARSASRKSQLSCGFAELSHLHFRVLANRCGDVRSRVGSAGNADIDDVSDAPGQRGPPRSRDPGEKRVRPTR